MKTPGEAAMDLPWLAPNVASMLTLARSSADRVWMELRGDPGIVLLAARVIDNSTPLDVALLDAVLQQQSQFDKGFVDWNQSGANAIYRACHQYAFLASMVAEKLGADVQRAWTAGFLAPLGWVAITAVDSGRVAESLESLQRHTNASAFQRQAWGHDHTALARRLCRCWRLPAWLSSVLGNLGLHAGIAERLGVEPKLFQIVQLSVLLVQERGMGLGLPVGATAADLLNALQLAEKEVAALAEAALQVEPATQSWESPAKHALLPELLKLALDNRRQNDAAWIERLQQDLDYLQEALTHQCSDEKNRLHTQKLSALAEFAAGAGHEINNPLAVISGQAQYVLKQMDWLDVPAEEIENVGEYLEGLRTKVTPSLQKIIAQTQRVHAILTELMHFARPHKPDLQPVSVRAIVSDVAEALQPFAQQRKVQVFVTGGEHDDHVHADPRQAREMLSGLLRNAIEAAPADGWAKVRIEKKKGVLDFVVEDNGAGPAPKAIEHLFDPFFSGRSAGRGRGMGLPIAWRLARQHGGDVRFDGNHDGVTRFVLTLPLVVSAPVHLNGYHTDTDTPNGVLPTAQARG